MSLERQFELEKQMLSLGEAHYRNELLDNDDDFDTAHIQKLVTKMIEPFSESVDSRIQHEISIYVRHPFPMMKLSNKKTYINRDKKDPTISSMQISFIVIRSIFMSLREGKRRMVACSADLGRRLNSNIINEDRFSPTEEIRIGAILIELLIKAFPYFFEHEVKDGVVSIPFTYFDNESRHKEYVVSPSEEFIEFCDEMIESIADMIAVIHPMIYTPAPWNDEGKEGGFYSEQLKKNIIKRKSIEEPSGINSNVATAINGIQATPWVVNWEIAEYLIELNKTKPATLEKIFPEEVPRSPDRPFDEKLKYADMGECQQKEHQLWSRTIKKQVKDRQAKVSVDLSREASIQQSVQFRHEPKIFFPHDLDYRERLYNMCMTGLNTQGSDGQKALVKFANPRAVQTEGGIYWMKINMANLAGHDKLRLDERVDWTNSNEALIRDVVKDPIGCTLWHSWDKPLQGLAAAIEYVKWLNNDQSLLNLHVQLDGLCNGVQNLAAITRDELVAPHVGLIWTPDRGDVYGLVNQKVIENITGSGAMATQWLTSELMTRSLPKTPVMTRSYGAKLYGIKEGVQEYIDKNKKTNHFDDVFKAGNWMGERIWETMDVNLKGPMEYMDWVQSCAGILADANLPMIWDNPIFGRCMQNPMVTKVKRLEVKMDGRVVKYQLQTPTNKINKSKAESSSSPNMIHGCDASHLMLTTNKCIDEGIDEFAMVHDSFGTYPDGASMLLHCAKESWVEMYDYNWMEHWHAGWSEQLRNAGVTEMTIPEPPKMGNLDIKEVRKSDFFFA